MMGIKIRKEGSLLLILICLSVSCAKIQVISPSSRFINPEAQGKAWQGGFKLIQQAGTEGTLDFEGERLDNSMELRNTSTPLAFSLDVGINHNLDFIYKAHASAPTVYTVKWQLMGANRVDAQVGNKSLAVTLGHGNSGQFQTQDDTSGFNELDEGIEAEITQSLLEASIIYGQRISNETVVYTSALVSKQDMSFKLESKDITELNDKTFTINTWNYGLALGAISYIEQMTIAVEASIQKTDYTRNRPTTYGFATMAVGYNW